MKLDRHLLAWILGLLLAGILKYLSGSSPDPIVDPPETDTVCSCVVSFRNPSRHNEHCARQRGAEKETHTNP